MTAVLIVVALVAGAIASIAGFGIGSVLTPAMALYVPAKLAVAAVSIPHFVATVFRLWLIREHIDYKVLRSFGVMSALGGLAGAGIHAVATSRLLELVLAVLLIFVGAGGLAGWTKRLRFEGPWAWIAGGVSGLLGGLVGNQGGLRAGAMTGLGVSRDAFVAISTAIGVAVDLARMPVYIALGWKEMAAAWPAILAMTAGVIGGTLLGMSILKRIPEHRFMQVVFVLLILLGLWLVAKG